MAKARAYSETGLQRLTGGAAIAAGLFTLLLSVVLSWMTTRDYPDSWNIEWYYLVLVRFPDNVGTLVGIVLVVVGYLTLLRARRTARILTDGVVASATVLAVTDTGTRVNNQPQLRLRLSVAAPGQEPYEVAVKKVVPMLSIARLRSGLALPVRVDPDDRARVIIDWAALADGTAEAERIARARAGITRTTTIAEPGWSSAPTPPGSGTPRVPGLPQVTRTPTSREDLKAQIRAAGMPGIAMLQTVVPIEPVDDRCLFRMDLVVRLDNGASYVEQDEPVPVDQEHTAKAVAGTRVPVRVALVDGVAVTLFEWERV